MKPLLLIDLDYTLIDTHKLKHEFPRLQEAIEHVAGLPDNSFNQYFYPDTISFIKYTQVNFHPAIFSEGPLQFQQDKIAKSSLNALIPPQYRFVYPPNSKNLQLKSIICKYSCLCLVDDKPDMIDHAIELHLPTIRILRGEHKHLSTAYAPTFSTSSLQEIINQDLLSQIKTASPPSAISSPPSSAQ